MNFFTYISEGFQLDIKLLFIVLFLGIISWKGVSRFNRGGGLFFSWGPSFLNGGDAPWGASVLVGGFRKTLQDGGRPPMPLPLWETLTFQAADPEICSILIFYKRIPASPPHFVYEFSRKIFLMLFSINWPNFIFWLPLLLEILANMCIVIICRPVCDIINFEINLGFLIKPFFYKTKLSGQKRKYLKNEKSLP